MPDQPANNSPADRLCERLVQIHPFSQLTQTARRTVAECARRQSFSPGDCILTQGETADCLIIMLEGTAEIVIDDKGTLRTIATAAPQSVIGEIGLITGEVRSASVIAQSQVHAAIISHRDVQQIVERFPRFSFVVYDLIADHIGKTDVDALCGKNLGPYTLDRRVGRGGMGVVYRAVERETGDVVALKMLRHDLTLDRQVAERFHREAAILRELRHPNIVCVRDEFFAYGTYFIAMDFCNGPTLSKFIEQLSPLSEGVVRQILGQLADALLHAHQAGIIHRDLKPSNIILEPNGMIRLIDLGLARSFQFRDTGISRFGDILGTPGYMSPEQLAGERGNDKSDLFAVGCIALELLTGQPAFRAKTITDIIDERNNWALPDRNEIRTELSDDLSHLLRDCLAAEPENRTLDLATIVPWATPIDDTLMEAWAAPQPSDCD